MTTDLSHLQSLARQLIPAPIAAGFASRPTAAWTVERVTTTTGPQWATVLVEEPDQIGCLLGRSTAEAEQAIRRLGATSR
jgi:hypothetical protein